MPDFCSCGAALPPEAVFCHKCGKPQREIAAAEPEVRRAEAPSPEPSRPLPLNFRNPIAVRIAFGVALGASCLFFLPYVNWLAGGYFAVFFYRRRTGQPLSVVLGVRLGWITGLAMFAIAATLIALFVIFLNSTGGAAAFQAELRGMADPKSQERVQQLLQILQNRAQLAWFFAQLFVFVTFLSMAGGALGAKLARPH